MANPFDQFDTPESSSNPFDQFDGVEDEDKKKKKRGFIEDAKLGLASSFAGIGNTADTALSTLAGGAAALFGDDKSAVDIYDQMEERRRSRNQWANPNNEEVGTTGKVIGTLGTLPMQMVNMGLSPAETTHGALEAGESNSAARKAGMVDAAGNIVGLAIPGWKQGSALVRGVTGAGANVAQELATKKAIQSMMETERGKEVFAPNMDDAIVSGIIGGGLGVGMGRKPQTPQQAPQIDLDAAMRALDATKQVAPPEAAPVEPGARVFDEMVAQQRAGEYSPVSFPPEGDAGRWMADQLSQRGDQQRQGQAQASLDARQAAMEQEMRQRATLEMNAAQRGRQEAAPSSTPAMEAHLAEVENARLAKQAADMQRMQQTEIDATPHVLPDTNQVIAPQYGAMDGVGRIDENGMPIKADLSMEAANLENPLQRNLWGDELGPSQGQTKSLTDAIDSMARGIPNRENGKFAPGTTRDSALNLLRGEIKADPALEAAKMQADTLKWLEANKRPPVEKTPLGSKARKAAVARMGRAKKQGGGITTDIFGRTPEKSERLHDVADYLPYRFQVLESLPNKTIFSAEQLRSALNRDGVSAQEKQILIKAWDIARNETGTAPDGSLFVGKAKATDFVDAIQQITESYTLSKTPTTEYASYGLDRLGRDAGERWETIPRNEWTPDQLEEYLNYNIFPERPVITDQGVNPTTNMWDSPDPLSAHQPNHFESDNYVGHTRNFKEDGVRHVVEIQSDLLQKHNISERPDTSYQNLSLDDLQRSIAEASEDYRNAQDAFEQAEASKALRELLVENNYREKVGNDPKIKTLQNNWAVRLIREELADAARARENTVRFATADTMAKVEGWENAKDSHETSIDLAEYAARDMETRINRFEAQHGQKPPTLVTELQRLRDKIERLKANPPTKMFEPKLQGIYDRYQKDVAKYLKSIGGKEVTDSQGHTWLEVPVDASRKRPIMFGQRGAVLFDWKKKPQVDQIEKIGAIKKALNAFVPSNMTPEAVIETAKGMKDVDQNVLQRISNAFTKGGLYQAEKTGNPIVKYTVDQVLNADRKTRADVQTYIHDSLAPAMRDLSNKELTDIAQVMNYADLKQVDLTPEFLRSQGFNEKQVSLAQAHRQTMDYAFESLNKARTAAGLEPISKRVGYAAMQATGDYQKLVYTTDADGEKTVVGIIGAKTRPGLEALQKKVMKKGYTFGEERYHGSGQNRTGSAVTAMMQALEHLADNDPKSKAFLDVLADLKTNEAYDFLNAKKHTLAKKGVFGMEGRKDWKSDYQNAKEFMDSQLHYAESALRWGHLSEASLGVKEVLAGDVNMPNAKKWAESYFQNALGLNPSETGRVFEKAVDTFWKTTGVGSTIPRTAMQYSRKTVNTLLLGLNPAFLATNVVQPLLSIPAMSKFLASRGLENTMMMGYDNMAKGGITSLKEQFGGMDALEKGAFEYAKKNHVYGSDLVDTSTLSRKGGEYYVDKAGNFLAANIESGTRKMVYYTFVHMLNENGIKDFGLAHNLTDMAMNNYSPVERPQVFNALGPIGDMASNLSSFKHNELSRIAMFAREVGKNGNMVPVLTQLATTVAAAGIQGTILYEEADWLYRYITKQMGKPDSLSRVVLDFSEKMSSAPHLLSHGVFSMLGLDMSKRLGISDTIPNSLGEAAFPGGSKLVDVGAAGLSALGDPSEMNLKRFAREAAPGAVTGPMDRAWFSVDTPAGELAQNRNTLKGQVVRTESDKRAKNFGFTGIDESVAKQKLYDLSQRNLAYSDLRTSTLKKMNDSLKATGKVTPSLIESYINYEGDPSTLAGDLAKMIENQQTDAVSAAMLRAAVAKSVPQLGNAQRTIQTLGGQ